MFWQFRRKSIAKYLRSHNKLGDSEKDKKIFDSFVTEYCHLDGAFIFQILRRNSNYLTTSDIIVALWTKYVNNYKNLSIHHHHESEDNNACDSVGIRMNEDDIEKRPFRSYINNNNN